MESSLLSISRIFSDRLFRIPDYQRGYSWGKKQLNDFWSDLEKIPDSKNHYTGVLTLEGVSKKIYDRWDEDKWIIESKKYDPFFIVDGQQRLTTIIILINSILEKFHDVGKINYTDTKDIQRKFIYDSKNDGISRSYIFGYEKDNPSYNFLKKEIFMERCDNDLEETIYTQNLKNAKQFFNEKIENFNKEKIEKLYINVTQNLMFNIFTIAEDVDVCIAFETMNNRGKPLSHLELLKNRLIYISTQVNSTNHDKDQLRRNINSSWKSIYHNLGRNKTKPLSDDEFLINHCNIYFYENLFEDQSDYYLVAPSRNKEIEDYSNFLLGSVFNQKNISSISLKKNHFRISLKTINDYAQSLKDVVEIWYYIFNPQFSVYPQKVKDILIRLNHLGMGSFVTTVLIFMKYVTNYEILYELLVQMERLLFILTIAKYKYFVPYQSAIRRGFLGISIQLKQGKLSEAEILKKIQETANEVTSNGDFTKALPEALRWSGGFYNWDTIRYFLYEYEMYLKSLTKNTRDKIEWESFCGGESDFVSVEHIYPQHARHQYWTSRFGKYSQKQKEVIRNSLGNLLPLSKRKNSSLSNKPFPTKAVGEHKDFVTYQFGSYSEIEVSKEKEWNPEKILERGIKMLNFMEHRWDIKLGTNEQKRKILGIEIRKKIEN